MKKKTTAKIVKSATATRCSTPPAINGNLDDNAWTNIKWMPGNNEDASILNNMPVTKAKIGFDNKALYFGFICYKQAESDNNTGKDKNKVRDDSNEVWKNDCIEIWLKPIDKEYHFVIERDGAIFDARDRGKAYNPDWEKAVAEDEEKWTVEIKIPFHAIELDHPIKEIKFNTGRNGPQFSPQAWYPKYASTEFSSLVLPDVKFLAANIESKSKKFSNTTNAIVTGKSLKVYSDRLYSRPGEKWLEFQFSLFPDISLTKTNIKAELFRLGERTPISEVSISPSTERGKIYVDLHSGELKNAELNLEFIENEQKTGTAKFLLSAKACENPIDNGTKIPIVLDTPQGFTKNTEWPIFFGVPFGRGQLWDTDNLYLLDEAERKIPCQKEITGRWALEGSIKWVRFDALVKIPSKNIYVVVDRRKQTENTDSFSGLSVREIHQQDMSAPRLFRIETGKSSYILGGKNPPISCIEINGKKVASTEATRGLYVVDQKGRTASAINESVTIEADGPVATCVRIEGGYLLSTGEELARHITRVECFSGQSFANITHTLVLSRNTNEIWFREIGWEFNTPEGKNNNAIYATSPTDFKKTFQVWIDDSLTSSFMLQDNHFRFAHDNNHFGISIINPDNSRKVLFEGKECGDWAMSEGPTYNMQFSCRDTARLHPKEFEITPDKVVLKLFSNNNNEELDFRMPALINKWNLKKWFEHLSTAEKKKKGGWENFHKKVSNHKNNAQGWARTHFIMLNPFKASSESINNAAETARLFSEKIYALTAPEWIYKTQVLGNLYPENQKRFPVIENYINDAFDWWVKTDAKWGEWGFVDYACGPHLWYNHPPYPYMGRYVDHMYLCRKNWWYLYARSGKRKIRSFMEKRTSSKIDFIQTHYDTATNVKGLYRVNHELSNLPFYWGKDNLMQLNSSAGFDDYLALYHLTGSRRAKECLINYIKGVKIYWSTSRAKECWRIIQLMKHLVHAYRLTWDPELKELIEATTDIFEDSRGELLLTKERPYRSTAYKTQTDIRSLIDAWDITGSPRYFKIAEKISKTYLWNQYFHDDGSNTDYNKPTAIVGNFLYKNSEDPVYAQVLSVIARNEAANYTKIQDKSILPAKARNAAFTNIIFELPYALDVIARTDADYKQLCSWFAYEDLESKSSIIVRKNDEDIINIQYNTLPKASPVVNTVGHIDGWAGLGLSSIHRVDNGKSSFGNIRIPYDMRAGTYRVSFTEKGKHYLFAGCQIPMVLYAPGFWSPLYGSMSPPLRYYFRLPPDTVNAKIIFKGKARLYTPEGKLFSEVSKNTVALPSESPGLWSFEITGKCTLKVENIPPYFSCGTAETYFNPEEGE